MGAALTYHEPSEGLFMLSYLRLAAALPTSQSNERLGPRRNKRPRYEHNDMVGVQLEIRSKDDG